MKTLLKSLTLLVGLIGAACAQTIMVPTTLSAALADSSTQVITVVSVSLTSGYTVVAGSDAYIDNELVTIKSVNSLVLGIIRGQGGTVAAPHASGAYVFLGPPQAFYSKSALEPQGSCTRSKVPYLPYINVRFGTISDCLGGQWTTGDRTVAPKFRINAPEPGNVLYTAINTAGTTIGATTVYCSEVFVPANKLLTGIALLNGTTVGTDKQYVILYDSGGTAIANSAVAGVLTATASVYQARAFTAKYYAMGPAQYFACFQSDTGTDSVRMAITGTNDNLLTKGQTSATFGTIPALTVPTTFTTAVGPYVYLY